MERKVMERGLEDGGGGRMAVAGKFYLIQLYIIILIFNCKAIWFE